jgi:heme/copper-type cytochrome/quinol oxidase subunit 1
LAFEYYIFSNAFFRSSWNAFRRIPDYPDYYAPLNFVASLGSIITFISQGFLILLIILALYNANYFNQILREAERDFKRKFPSEIF